MCRDNQSLLLLTSRAAGQRSLWGKLSKNHHSRCIQVLSQLLAKEGYRMDCELGGFVESSAEKREHLVVLVASVSLQTKVWAVPAPAWLCASCHLPPHLSGVKTSSVQDFPCLTPLCQQS